MGTGGAVAFTLYDPLGSTAALVGSSGANALAEAYRFDGYGLTLGSQTSISGGNLDIAVTDERRLGARCTARE